jgi:surface protein
MPSFSSLSSVTKATFKATSGVPPNVIIHGTQTIDLAGLSLGANSVQVTHPGIVSALSSGNTISHSLQIEHGGLSVVETAGTPYVTPPDYSVTQFSQYIGFELSQYGKYVTGVRFRTSSVGGSYGHKVDFYPTSSPATKTFVNTDPAEGDYVWIYVSPLDSATDYTVAVTLVNMNTGQELANLQPVQTITFTTPPPPVMLDTNGVTLKYTSSSIPSGQSNPYIVQVSGTYYAVMSSNNDDSKSKIQAYAAFVGSNPNPTTATPSFTAPDNTSIPFNRIVTTLMTDMGLLFFYNYSGFNQNISSWDTSNVTNMSNMFGFAEAFNQNIGYWNTSKVTDMNAMFYNAIIFKQDISAWNVTLVQPKPPFVFSQNSGLTNALLPPAFRPPPIENILSKLYTKVETTLNFAISVGSSPFREALALAFDGNNYTKYLNFNGAGSDVLIDAGANYVVTGLGLTTANDGPERDPTSYTLYGSNTPFVITNFVNPNDFWVGGSNFASGGLPGQTLIASGSLNPPLERVTDYPNVTFSNNSTIYRYYRLVFDSIRNLPYTANCLQISEIRLAGYL